MSILFDASDLQHVGHSGGPDYNAAYTFLGWFWFDSLATNQGLFYLATSVNNYDAVYFDASDGFLHVGKAIGGLATNTAWTTAISTGQWYHIAMRRSTANALNLDVELSQKVQSTGSVSARFSAATSLTIGNILGSTSWKFTGKVASVHGFSASLTPSTQQAPVRFHSMPRHFATSWHGTWQLTNILNLQDMTPNGHDLTATGTLANSHENPPGVVMSARRERRVRWTPVAGGPPKFLPEQLGLHALTGIF